MRPIYEVLSDPKLTITCDPKLKDYGLSFPGIRRIKLDSAWMNETRPYERTQTLVHEAAQIAGIVNIAEGRKYGPARAKRLAMHRHADEPSTSEEQNENDVHVRTAAV